LIIEGFAPEPQGLYASGLPVKWKNGKPSSPPFHRISRDKREVAPQHCFVYVAL
jgi:hypothetical protein